MSTIKSPTFPNLFLVVGKFRPGQKERKICRCDISYLFMHSTIKSFKFNKELKM